MSDEKPKKPAQPKKPKTTTKGKPLTKPRLKGTKPVPPKKKPVTQQEIEEALVDGLTLKEIEFVEAWLTCYNATKAYMSVYTDCKHEPTASVYASKILSKGKIRAYTAKRMAAFVEDSSEIAAKQLLQSYMYLAYGDANELVEYRRECCRYCYGKDHRYQFTPSEMQRAKEQHEREQRDEKREAQKEGKIFVDVPFDEQGGVGFNPRLDPHPDCPECFGEGKGKVHFKDTRNLSPAAQLMYAGTKISKDGIEIKMNGREKPMEVLAKVFKLIEDKTVNNVIFTSEELEAKFGDAMAAAAARQQRIDRERGGDAQEQVINTPPG